jgi:hypothetical protein
MDCLNKACTTLAIRARCNTIPHESNNNQRSTEKEHVSFFIMPNGFVANQRAVEVANEHV